MNSTWVMARTFLKIFSKDRQAIFFTLFFPIAFMVVFGFLNSGDDEPMEIGIVDDAGSELSQRFAETLSNNLLFEVTYDDESKLRERVIGGDLTLVLVLPLNFQDGGDSTEITMLIDAAQARQTALVVPVIEQALLDAERELRQTKPLFTLNVVDVQARSQRYIDFLVPGLLALSLMQISIAGSGFNIVEYRRKGILKRLFVTPIRPAQFIGGLVTARLILTVVQVSVLLGFAVFLLKVAVVGSYLSILPIILLGSSIFLSLGFFMGSLAKTQQSIMLLGNLITFPQMFLSGVFYSIDSMPELIQPLAQLLPLSFVVTALREVMINGLTPFTQISIMLGLVAWLGISLALAIRFFVWKEVAT